MEQILSHKRKPEDDYYDILGCDQLSSVPNNGILARFHIFFGLAENNRFQTEQILTEYKIRALELHPDKNPKDSSAGARFKELQKAKEILTDPTKRKFYDLWLSSGIAIDFDDWLSKRQIVNMVSLSS